MRAWLAAYLAAISWFGYRYALHERLYVIRQQIVDPGTELVPRAAINLVARHDLRDPQPLSAMMAQPVEAVVVYFPMEAVNTACAMSVLLPWLTGPAEFYLALSDRYAPSEHGRRIDVQARALGWPTGPALTLDFAAWGHSVQAPAPEPGGRRPLLRLRAPPSLRSFGPPRLVTLEARY